MSEGLSTPFTPEGGLTVDFAALLLLGRERGYLTPDDLMAVLEAVELTPPLIDAVVGRVRAEGIKYDEEGDALGVNALGFERVTVDVDPESSEAFTEKDGPNANREQKPVEPGPALTPPAAVAV